MVFCPRGKKMTKSLSWLWFFAQGEKDPVYSIQSGSKVAYYTFTGRAKKQLFESILSSNFKCGFPYKSGYRKNKH
jgi:hypothetical protein